MNNEKLQKGKELEKRIEFHQKQEESFKVAIKCAKDDYGSVHKYYISSGSFDARTCRKKAIITFLEIEAQYHFQEMKKFERELERL